MKQILKLLTLDPHKTTLLNIIKDLTIDNSLVKADIIFQCNSVIKF